MSKYLIFVAKNKIIKNSLELILTKQSGPFTNSTGKIDKKMSKIQKLMVFQYNVGRTSI